MRKGSMQDRFTAAFAKIDDDGSGELDYAELLTVCGGIDIDGDVRALFEHLDEDGSGTISAKELLRELRTNPEARMMAGKFEGLQKFVKIANRTKQRRKSSSSIQISELHHESHGEVTKSRLKSRRASLQGRLDLHLEREATRRAAAAVAAEEYAAVKGPPAGMVRPDMQ